jgi:hypothetical protein
MSDWILNGAGEPVEVRKYGTVVPVSRDTAIDLGMVKPTAKEQAKRDAWAAEYERRKQAATEAWPRFVAALNGPADPVVHVVLDLHKADRGQCRGCEFDGYEAEPPSWPCATTTTISAALGIPVPPDLDIAEQARA